MRGVVGHSKLPGMTTALTGPTMPQESSKRVKRGLPFGKMHLGVYRGLGMDSSSSCGLAARFIPFAL
jgi:hypothetical protein